MPNPSDMPRRATPPALTPTRTLSEEAAAVRLLAVHAYTRPNLRPLAPAWRPGQEAA